MLARDYAWENFYFLFFIYNSRDCYIPIIINTSFSRGIFANNVKFLWTKEPSICHMLRELVPLIRLDILFASCLAFSIDVV